MKQSNFKFKSPEVENVIFAINEDFNEEKYEGITIEGHTRIQKSDDNQVAKVKLRIIVGENSEKFPFCIDIIVAGLFSWSEDLNNKKDTVDELLRINAPTLLMSYARTVIASVTAFTKYSTFNLPFINMEDNEAEYICDERFF